MERHPTRGRTVFAAIVIALSLVVTAIALGACSRAYNYGSAAFSDGQHGWVSGWDPVKSKTVLTRTTDGGATWVRVGARATPKNTRVAGWAEFSTPTTGVWAVGRGSPLYTTTGGRPWTRATTRDAHGVRTMSGSYYSAASFATATVGWATLVRGDVAHAGDSSGGFIVRTRDAGATWRIKKAVYGEKGDPSGGFCDVAAPTGRICYALRAGVRGGVYATVDTGVTWKRQVLPTDTTAYEALEFVDATTGYAVGGAGMIAKTIDGGLTWTPQVSGTTERLHGVCFVDATHGWAVGEMGTILVTQDGGADWAPQVSGWVPDPEVENGNMVINDVEFVSATEGWAVVQVGWSPGQKGTLLHTTDGGVNWQMIH
jgi:photosystem II stability/assembly factor-like uncharacterized protein